MEHKKYLILKSLKWNTRSGTNAHKILLLKTELEPKEEDLTMFMSNEYEEESGLFLYNAM